MAGTETAQEGGRAGADVGARRDLGDERRRVARLGEDWSARHGRESTEQRSQGTGASNTEKKPSAGRARGAARASRGNMASRGERLPGTWSEQGARLPGLEEARGDTMGGSSREIHELEKGASGKGETARGGRETGRAPGG